MSAFLDLFLAVYPATVLYRLQMNRKKKIGLMMILGMGLLYAPLLLQPVLQPEREIANESSACAISIYKATRLTGLDVLTDYTCMPLPTLRDIATNISR